MVGQKFKTCLPCQAATTGTLRHPEPLIMTPLPDAPWQEVAVEFVGPFPSGELLLVVIDEFCRFPEVEIVTTTSAKAVIPKLDNIFSRQSVPVVIMARRLTARNLNNSPVALVSNIAKSLRIGQRRMEKWNGLCAPLKKPSVQHTSRRRTGNKPCINFSASTEPHRTARRMCRHPRP